MIKRDDREFDKQEQRPNGEAEKNFTDTIIGRHAVSEAIRTGRDLDSVLVARGDRSGAINSLIAKARELRIPVKEVDIKKLDFMGRGHQGVAAIAACVPYSTIDDLFEKAEKKNEPPFFIICDELEDPHNLGAILRTAEAAAAHGVIIPERRSVGLTTAVYKASAGAVEHVPVARVVNITRTIKELKDRGVWIYGLDMDGEKWCETEMTGPVALVIGSEGQGISRLVKENCDFIVSLPMLGEIPSLNASVACGIVLYEIARQRNEWKSV